MKRAITKASLVYVVTVAIALISAITSGASQETYQWLSTFGFVYTLPSIAVLTIWFKLFWRNDDV